jgi:hypothetical protein
MNPEPQDPIWERFSKTLFATHRMEDEGLFTYAVMQKIRGLDIVRNDKTWHQFLRWAIPALGVGVASLVLATRTPSFSYEDPINVTMEDWR